MSDYPWIRSYPDGLSWDEPVALKAGAQTISLDEMKAFLKPLLGKHEMIAELEIRGVLPKTPVGKLSKKDLVEEELRKQQGAPPN